MTEAIIAVFGGAWILVMIGVGCVYIYYDDFIKEDQWTCTKVIEAKTVGEKAKCGQWSRKFSEVDGGEG